MIAWVDIETTGLDPDATDARILEVGIIITDDQLNIIASCDQVVAWSQHITRRLDSFIQEMHTQNGLLDEVVSSVMRDSEVEQMMVNFMQFHCPEPPVLGGSTVSFDRAWLSSHMPDLHERFHYRNVDVTSVRELAHRWRPELTELEPTPDGLHRVIPDLLDSIALARFYQTHIFNKESE